ncbi:hypothetical protein [Escherichia coli]|mgnify:FL=1|uniref:hypothetical protein n=1 Tax=Escherichia coli TaxID=562 RepID=UPI0003BDF9AD|nr:hypothetical protein [Escherichia coli]ESK37504.1 hypothetical protein G966_01523 [Escherichia coli UMEA 3323-1]OSP30494.1 hypothetical protein B9P94_14165 [Escherichia coli]OYC70339.1 hypothetical protein RX31_00116 [Escherichia coli]HAI4759487.1 hypothetical protein [Escherichia coli]HAI7157069.1 hypothetical protein [Escherichia coli]
MKSNRKRLVRAYDKALKAFDDLRHNKRQRRKWARMLVYKWHYFYAFMESAPLLTQEQADEVANDNVYYMTW